MSKKHQNGPRSTPKRTQNERKRTKKAIPNDKTTREPNQHDFWTVLDPPKGPEHSSCAFLGGHLGGQIGTKTEPKTIQNRSEKSRGKKNDPRRSWTRLGAILGRLGAPSWAKQRLKPFVLNGFVNNYFFKAKTVRRRFWDQLWPTKAPKGPKMTP